MAANQQLLDTIATLIKESDHTPEDILESTIALAGCMMQASDMANCTIHNHDGSESFTLIHSKKE